MAPLEEELDRLYRLPLAEFVRERNALAAALKKASDHDTSRRVKELAKPSASAWAVNQLYWKDLPLVERLLRSGDRYREAQRRALAGEGPEGLAAAEEERRQAIADAVHRVREILDIDERSSGSAVLSRAAATLEALASYGSDNPTPVNGRLSRDLESPGFGALASLGEIVPTGAAASATKREEESERAASRKLEEEEAALAKAVERERRARAELDLARSRWKEAEERLRRAEAEAEAAEKSRADREASVEEAKLRVKRRE